MRYITVLAGLSAALIAMPAAAQLGTTLGGAVNTTVGAATNVGVPTVGTKVGTAVNTSVNAGVDTAAAAGTAGRVTTAASTAGSRSVGTAERALGRSMAAANLSLATRQQVRTGLVVRDTRGQRIGTVSSLDANSAIVVSGNRMYHVPLGALYTRSTGAVTSLVTSVPRAQLTTHVAARANANSAVQAGH